MDDITRLKMCALIEQIGVYCNALIKSGQLPEAEIDTIHDIKSSAVHFHQMLDQLQQEHLDKQNSHNLRTRLTAIMGFSGLLLEFYELTDSDYNHVRGIYDNGKNLLKLINSKTE